jgi:TfoX/Sxy family transcriptional regulator of competence genes
MPEMPKFTKSSPEIVERFGAAMERLAAPDVTQRKMFGYPCAWIAGNMATGLFAEEWWVRVSEPERDQLLEMGGHPFAPMPGKAMGRYVVMPAAVVDDEGALDGWLTRALECTRTLPPKR